MKGKFRMAGGGRHAKNILMDAALLDWINKLRHDPDHPRRPARTAIMEQAAALWTGAGLPPPKAKWLRGFLRRNKLCMRTPKRLLKVPIHEVMTRINAFHNVVRSKSQLFGPYALIANTDESPMSFSGGPLDKVVIFLCIPCLSMHYARRSCAPLGRKT